MADFKLKDNLDIDLDNLSAEEDNRMTTVINAFFTDDRIGDSRGYWYDLLSSKIWKYEQARITEETAREITETAKSICKKLEGKGVFTRVDALAKIESGKMYLLIKCFDNTNLISERQFKI